MRAVPERVAPAVRPIRSRARSAVHECHVEATGDEAKEPRARRGTSTLIRASFAFAGKDDVDVQPRVMFRAELCRVVVKYMRGSESNC